MGRQGRREGCPTVHGGRGGAESDRQTDGGERQKRKACVMRVRRDLPELRLG